MHPDANGLLRLRVYAVIGDKHQNQPLHEAIVSTAHAVGLAGATVIRGVMGYGKAGMIHSDLLTDVESHLIPVIIEIVDEEVKVAEFASTLREMVQERRLITVQPVNSA